MLAGEDGDREAVWAPPAVCCKERLSFNNSFLENTSPVLWYTHFNYTHDYLRGVKAHETVQSEHAVYRDPTWCNLRKYSRYLRKYLRIYSKKYSRQYSSRNQGYTVPIEVLKDVPKEVRNQFST